MKTEDVGSTKGAG